MKSVRLQTSKTRAMSVKPGFAFNCEVTPPVRTRRHIFFLRTGCARRQLLYACSLTNSENRVITSETVARLLRMMYFCRSKRQECAQACLSGGAFLSAARQLANIARSPRARSLVADCVYLPKIG